ncbi:MAG: hypothetical protein JRI68_00450 [Deltaproteobacteria bacterium]|nr:hypothetical protein [Deltaproteobacteria bacterium]
MSRSSLLGIALVLLVVVGGCGGATPSPESPGGPGATVPEPNIATGESADEEGAARAKRKAGDVAPVTEPGAVLFHLRFRSLTNTVATFASFAQLPPQIVDEAMDELAKEVVSELLGGKVDRRAFREVLDLSAPVDVVVIADTSKAGQFPEPMAAISFGLTSMTRARAAASGRGRKLAEGVWRVGPAESWGDACALADAAGRAPARLICADNERQLTAVAPFVARNLPVIPEQPSDVRAELRLRGLFDKYGRQWANQARGLPILIEDLKNGIPVFDDALMRAASALAAEAGALIHDADQLVVDFSLDRSKGIVVRGEARFVGKRSWIVESMLDGAHLAGPAPDLLWHLPEHSSTVSYGRSVDPTRYEPVFKVLRGLVEGALQDQKFGTHGDRKALSRLLRLPLKKHVATVGAHGSFPAPTTPARGPAKSLLTDVVNAGVGWHLLGVESGPAPLRQYLKDVVAAYNRPTLQGLMKKELGTDAKHLPIVKVVRAPRQLGGGALDVQIKIPKIEEPSPNLAPPGPGGPPPGPPKLVDVEVHVLLMADGGRSWVGIAGDRTALAKLMAGLKGAKPGPGSMAQRSNLGRLRTEKHASGMVASLDGVIRTLKPLASVMMTVAPGSAQHVGQQVMTMLGQLPNQGKTPITFFVDVEESPKPRSTFTLQVPTGTLTDIGYIVTRALTIAQQATP